MAAYFRHACGARNLPTNKEYTFLRVELQHVNRTGPAHTHGKENKDHYTLTVFHWRNLLELRERKRGRW